MKKAGHISLIINHVDKNLKTKLIDISAVNSILFFVKTY
ncbi:Uncharacterized protein dnl_61830 [Desulfonema limicola]|uniref:Uncharacterized protein n=1 Tax=Desulfonema limicola TaxID=45656 RepID=A0A975BEC8_9BACT|nr:Uncharacterized protein dnl_61830 [Desulfonema limicola]